MWTITCVYRRHHRRPNTYPLEQTAAGLVVEALATAVVVTEVVSSVAVLAVPVALAQDLSRSTTI